MSENTTKYSNTKEHILGSVSFGFETVFVIKNRLELAILLQPPDC